MKELRNKFLNEIKTKELFKKAEEYAFEYMDGVQERDVFPDGKALEALNSLNTPLNEEPEDALAILDTMHRYCSPATVAQTGGRYFGFVNGGAIPASLGAEWLSTVWDQNPVLYVASPAVSMIEEVCERWFRELFGLPDTTAAGFVSGSSTAAFCGLAAARYRLLKKAGWDVNQDGLCGAPALKIILSEQAHATVFKALALLGFGRNQLTIVPADDQGRIVSSAMPEPDDRTLIILQAGNVNTGAFDNFEEICTAANKKGAWVHIDGAFGLWAQCSANRRHLTKGIELADSWSLDGHKTLNTPYDCAAALCKDREALINAMQASGSYIIYSGKRDSMLFTPEMSRRARAVDLWSAMKALGKSGIDALVDDLCLNASLFAGKVKDAGFEVLNDVVFNQVIFRYRDKETTAKILEKVQKSGAIWSGSSVYKGEFVVRMSVCSWVTDENDISAAAEAFINAKKAVCG